MSNNSIEIEGVESIRMDVDGTVYAVIMDEHEQHGTTVKIANPNSTEITVVNGNVVNLEDKS